MIIDVIRDEPEPVLGFFRRTCWRIRFVLKHGHVVARVIDYRRMIKMTRSNRWEVVTTPGTNYSARNNDPAHNGNGLPISRVPLPDTVRDEAVAILNARVAWQRRDEGVKDAA